MVLQVSGVAFDSYWSPPNADDTGESVMYRFGSVGQVLKNACGHLFVTYPMIDLNMFI